MGEQTRKLLDLIGEGYCANDICTMLNLSHKQLYHRLNLLRNDGFDFVRKYYSSGDIVYQPRTEKELSNQRNDISICTSKNANVFKALVISDLHIGSISERLDLLDNMYNYCVKEGIHIIVNAGDLINGMFGRQNLAEVNNNIAQVDYLVKKYPFDKNILNFVVLGNHDLSPLKECGLDLAMRLNNSRHDIVPLGYDIGCINVKNDSFVIQHSSEINANKVFPEASFILKGHSHKMMVSNLKDSNFSLSVPTLSDILIDNNTLPGAIKMTIEMQGGYFITAYFEHLVIMDSKVYSVNVINQHLGVARQL